MKISTRKDARLCYDVPSFNHIFPYLLQRRCDSQVFYDVELDVTNALRFVKEWNRSHPNLKTRLSTVIIASLLRTIALRPRVNRFIANRTYWERNDLSLSFVVKKDLNDDTPETTTPLYFDRYASFEDTISIIEKYIEDSQKDDITEENNFTEYTINKLFKFLPQWLLKLVVKFYGYADQNGHGCPKWVRDADGLHVSIYVANIGSIGMKNAHHHHHLYEWGTTSLFCVLEDLRRVVEKDKDGNVISTKDVMGCSFTIDERICDGFYFMQSINHFSKLLKEPENLLIKLTEKDIPHYTTKEEYKKKMKLQKQAIKEAKRNKRKQKRITS